MYQASSPTTQPIPKLIVRARSFTKIASLSIIGLGCFVLAGWFLNISMMKSILPWLATMKVNSALMFILCGVSLQLHINRKNQLLARLLAASVFLIGIITLGEYLLNRNFGIDQFILMDIDPGAMYPGRPSSGTALCFSLAGIALFYLHNKPKYWFQEAPPVLIFILVLVALAGYIYDVASLYQINFYSSMALHTSVGLLLVALTIFFAYPERKLPSILFADTAGGRILRHILPTSILLPIFLGWVGLKGYQAGFYDADFRLAFVITMLVVVQIIFVWANALQLNKIDHANRQIFKDLQASETRFRTIIEGMTEGFQIIGFDWRHLYVNDAAVKNTRLNREQLVGYTLQECFPGLEKPTLKAFQTAMENRTTQELIMEYVFPDGESGWYDVRIHPSDEGIFILSTDITEHYRADQAIREREEKLHRLFEILPVGITVLDDKRNIILTNPAVNRVLQITEQGLRTGAYVNRTYLRADGTPMPPVEFPSMRAIEEGREILDVEIGVVKEDGKTIWTNVSAVPVNFSDWKVLTLTSDITSHKQAEERFQLAVEAAPNTILMVDINGRIALVNSQAEKSFGYHRDELLGLSVERLIPRRFLRGHLQYRAEFSANPQRRAMGIGRELFAVRKDGSEFPVEIGLAPIETYEDLFIMATVIDISTRKQAERTLKETYERQQRIINSMFAFVGILSLDGVLLEANRAPLEATGLTPEQVFGQPFASIPAFSSSEIAQKLIRDSLEIAASGEVTRVDLPMSTPGGHVVIIDSNFAPLHDATGKIIQVIVSGVDVTERKRAEDALRESEQKAHSLLNAIPDLMFRMDRDGIFLDYKADLQDLYTNSTDIVGKRIHDLLPPEFADLVERQIQRTLETREMQLFEYQLPIPGSGMHDYEARMVSSGPDKVISIVRDITNRKQAEEAIRASQKLLQDIVDNTPALIYMLDVDGQVLLFNRKLKDLIGLSTDELTGKTRRDFIPEEIAAQHRNNDLEVIRTQSPQTFVEENQEADGIHYYLTTKFPIFDTRDDIYAICGISVDITARIKAEENLQQLNLELEEKVAQRTAELAEANEQLRQLAIKDQLTGLYNRRGFIFLAEEQILLAKRSGRNILIYYADLDGLKQINDTFGHKAGDKAIIQTAQAINETFRASDIKARFGGDEFVILAIEAHKDDDVDLLARLHYQLAQYNLSVSVGVVSFDAQNDIPIEELLAHADEAMYIEKQKKTGHQASI